MFLEQKCHGAVRNLLVLPSQVWLWAVDRLRWSSNGIVIFHIRGCKWGRGGRKDFTQWPCLTPLFLLLLHPALFPERFVFFLCDLLELSCNLLWSTWKAIGYRSPGCVLLPSFWRINSPLVLEHPRRSHDQPFNLSGGVAAGAPCSCNPKDKRMDVGDSSLQMEAKKCSCSVQETGSAKRGNREDKSFHLQGWGKFLEQLLGHGSYLLKIIGHLQPQLHTQHDGGGDNQIRSHPVPPLSWI